MLQIKPEADGLVRERPDILGGGPPNELLGCIGAQWFAAGGGKGRNYVAITVEHLDAEFAVMRIGVDEQVLALEHDWARRK